MIDFQGKSTVVESVKGTDMITILTRQVLYMSLIGGDRYAFSFSFDALKAKVPPTFEILYVKGSIMVLRNRLLECAKPTTQAIYS